MKWVEGITKVNVLPKLPGNSPANVNPSTGEMQLSQFWLDRLPECHVAFIVLHEIHHIKQQTTDERVADAAAFEAYKKLGYPIECSVYALTEVLNMKNPEHKERAVLAYRRALQQDYPTKNYYDNY